MQTIITQILLLSLGQSEQFLWVHCVVHTGCLAPRICFSICLKTDPIWFCTVRKYPTVRVLLWINSTVILMPRSCVCLIGFIFFLLSYRRPNSKHKDTRGGVGDAALPVPAHVGHVTVVLGLLNDFFWNRKRLYRFFTWMLPGANSPVKGLTHQGHIRDTLWRHWWHTGDTLETHWGHTGDALGTHWGHSRDTLDTYLSITYNICKYIAIQYIGYK